LHHEDAKIEKIEKLAAFCKIQIFPNALAQQEAQSALFLQ